MIQAAEEWALAVILFGGAALTCVTVVWRAWPPVKHFMEGFEAMQELIYAQLRPNGGTSLVDKVDHIHDTLIGGCPLFGTIGACPLGHVHDMPGEGDD